MGTLDDAIREHLELKRKAGSSAEEVRKLESEALGPARRDAAPPAEPEPVEAPPAYDPADYEPPAPVAREPEPVREPEPARAPEPVAPQPEPEPVADAPAPAVSETPAPQPQEPEWLDEDPFGDAGPTPQTTGNPPSDYVAPDEEGDDLLEETPDFLQETPEHDRLWFEQKPPRDFDFDN